LEHFWNGAIAMINFSQYSISPLFSPKISGIAKILFQLLFLNILDFIGDRVFEVGNCFVAQLHHDTKQFPIKFID
jgi:hypothetical protein